MTAGTQVCRQSDLSNKATEVSISIHSNMHCNDESYILINLTSGFLPYYERRCCCLWSRNGTMERDSDVYSPPTRALMHIYLGDAGDQLKALALPLVRYGVQVRKVCAICSDFMDGCASKQYGGNVTHSGLWMLPLMKDSTEIANGTHKTILYCHGTRAVTQPSTDFDGKDSGIEIILNLLFTATTGSFTIMPDYMGQGESFANVFRGYIARESYETSVIPLYLQARKTIKEETECSAVSKSVFLMGYSEGGYSSLAVADKLFNVGYGILQVHSGGAPY